jgi:hypothetical protein
MFAGLALSACSASSDGTASPDPGASATGGMMAGSPGGGGAGPVAGAGGAAGGTGGSIAGSPGTGGMATGGAGMAGSGSDAGPMGGASVAGMAGVDSGAGGTGGMVPGTSPDAAPDMVAPPVMVPANTVTGSLRGLPSGKTATVLLGNGGYLASQTVAAGGSYRFEGVPSGTYFLKVQAVGVTGGPARSVRVGTVAPLTVFSTDAPITASAGPIDFQLGALPANSFRYHWEEDPSPAGYEETAHVNTPPTIEFLNEPVSVPELAAVDTLRAQFNVILSNEGVPWNQEQAYRLLETLRSVPQPIRKNEGELELAPSKWILTDQHLETDVTLAFGPASRTVTISTDAFVYAAPRLVLLNGERGRFFSKRLHHAVVRYATRNGEDHDAVERILQDRFGCTTIVDDHAALTNPTTKEAAGAFQAFHPGELVQIINTFEEMPAGYHKVSGLKYLLRRKDGQPHPWYVAAPAVAWALPEAFPAGSYIEFMDSAFNADPDDTHRLILHEKSHFLWGYVLSKALRDEWTTLGGWYPNSSDPDGWSTSKQTEFVSAYAHKKNPNEDLAESVAYFVLNPAALQSRSPAKFAFIRDRIMQGTRYLSQIQKDLTFEVLNLYPDYQYPGKIKRVDITSVGAPDADKVLTVEIALHTADRIFAGASRAYLRLYSPINTYEDMYLLPIDQTGAVLRGSITISKYAKSGDWRPDQIVVTDNVGNQRLEGVHDYGWKLYVENPMEDVTPPQYVPGSLTLQKFDDTVTEAGVTHPVQRIEVRWRYVEDRVMRRVYAKLNNPAANNVYPMESYGTFDAATSTALVTFNITPFMSSGNYGVPYISMIDAANNPGAQFFSALPQHQPLVSIPVVTTDIDTDAPHVALNDGGGVHRILVSAQPTNPDHPNGETLVVIKYQARDDKAGLGSVSYRLLDPQGISHFEYHYHPNFYTPFFAGDPTAWGEYEIRAVLPVGSAPGRWGLQQLNVRDKAGNQRLYDFVETLTFMVEK